MRPPAGQVSRKSELVESDTTPATSSALPALRVGVPTPDWARFLPMLWIVGALIGAVHFSFTARRSFRTLRANTQPFPAELSPSLHYYVTKHHPEIRLATTNALVAPMAVFPDTVVLPRWALSELSATELRATFAHERAHLTHRDPLWRMVLALSGRIFFFQPLHAIALRRFDELAESAADRAACHGNGVRRALASSIVLVAERTTRSRLGPGVSALVRQPSSPLLARVAQLVAEPAVTRPNRVGAASLAVAIVAMTLTLVTIEAAQRVDRNAAAEPGVTGAQQRWALWSTEATPWDVNSSTRNLRDVVPQPVPTSGRLWMLTRFADSGLVDGAWFSTEGPPIVAGTDLQDDALSNADSLARITDLRLRVSNPTVASELGAAAAAHQDWRLAAAAARSFLVPTANPRLEEPEEIIQWLARRPPASAAEDEALTEFLVDLALSDRQPSALEAVDSLGQRLRVSATARAALRSVAADAGDPAISDEALEWLAPAR
ncbi:MAG: M48 family metalloprotease [Acidobacteria bacterium]|nr:M48 family metalloprotease [Acidobacteriota bacterium]